MDVRVQVPPRAPLRVTFVILGGFFYLPILFLITEISDAMLRKIIMPATDKNASTNETRTTINAAPKPNSSPSKTARKIPRAIIAKKESHAKTLMPVIHGLRALFAFSSNMLYFNSGKNL